MKIFNKVIKILLIIICIFLLSFSVAFLFGGDNIRSVLLNIRYIGSIAKFSTNIIGQILFMIIPLIILLFYLFCEALDNRQDRSKHKKRILRKRQRRRQRYKNENLFYL